MCRSNHVLRLGFPNATLSGNSLSTLCGGTPVVVGDQSFEYIIAPSNISLSRRSFPLNFASERCQQAQLFSGFRFYHFVWPGSPLLNMAQPIEHAPNPSLVAPDQELDEGGPSGKICHVEARASRDLRSQLVEKHGLLDCVCFCSLPFSWA